MTQIGLPLISFFICLTATPLVARLARQKAWIAQPSEDRWHKKPTALMGGIAIFAGMAGPLFFTSDFLSLWDAMLRHAGPGHHPSAAAAIFAGASLLFILGLLDDFINIKPHTKLIGQIMVASMIAFLGFRLQWFQSLTLDMMLTIFWIVGITNAFNLLDNMDGLCAGTGLIASLFLAYTFLGNDTSLTAVALCMAGALAAFLIFNFNPASIFMGDCGSLPIGFALSMLTLCYAGGTAQNDLAAIAVPVLVLLVPIFDTTLVTFIRILSGRKASQGGRDHTSHRLVLMGFSERTAVLFLYGVGAASGLSAVFVSKTDTFTSPMVIIPAALSIVLLGIYLAQLRVYPEKEFSTLRHKSFTPILLEVTYKKQLLLVLFDFCLISFSYYLSYRLRFSGAEFSVYFQVFLKSLPAVIACKFIAFFIVGIYRGIWQYMSTNDIFVYLKASVFATLLTIVSVTFIYRFEDFSKGIFLIDWLLTTTFLVGTRGSFRFFLDTLKRKGLQGDRVLIYGAGTGGEILLKEILNNPGLALNPVGFIDDDYLKTGKKLQGYPVLGSFEDLPDFFEKQKISGLLISFNKSDARDMDAILSFCRKENLFIKKFSIHLEDIEDET